MKKIDEKKKNILAPRTPQRALIHEIKRGVAGPNPYVFLTVPKGRSQSLLQAFEVIEDSDDDETALDDDEEADDNDDEMNDDNDEEEEKDNLDKMSLAEEDMDAQLDDDDDDDNENDENDNLDNVMNVNLKLRKPNAQVHNAKPTQMMVSREHAGAILVPDEVVEIEGQSVFDEKTGKPALLLPRAILDSIPDGSVVALMERSVDDEQAEERANRVIVRRRRKGARRNIKRRRGNKRRVNRRGGNKRRRVNRRKNVRVVRRGNKRRGNKRRGNKRRGGANRRRVNRRRRVRVQG